MRKKDGNKGTGKGKENRGIEGNKRWKKKTMRRKEMRKKLTR
jgi:hypothetical protein